MGYLALFSLALGVLRFLAWGAQQLWGKNARIEAKIAWFEAQKVIAKAERERLKGVYKKIDEAPPPDDPAKGLSDAWNKKK